MAYEIPGFALGTRVAAADLSSSQFKFVKLAADNKVALAGAGELALGALQNKPIAGEAANVMVNGTSKVVAGDTIVEGAIVAADAAGDAVTAAAGAWGLGLALNGAADGDIVEVQLVNLGLQV